MILGWRNKDAIPGSKLLIGRHRRSFKNPDTGISYERRRHDI